MRCKRETELSCMHKFNIKLPVLVLMMACADSSVTNLTSPKVPLEDY